MNVYLAELRRTRAQIAAKSRWMSARCETSVGFHRCHCYRRVLVICAAALLASEYAVGQQREDTLATQIDQQRGLLERCYVNLPLLDGAIKVEIRTRRIVERAFVLVPSGDDFLLMVPRIHYLMDPETKEVRVELRCGFPKLSKEQAKICGDIVEAIRRIQDVPPPQSYSSLDGEIISIIFDKPHEKTKTDPFAEDPNRITWVGSSVKGKHHVHLESLIDQLGEDLIGFVALKE